MNQEKMNCKIDIIGITYADIMSLPRETENEVMFNHLKNSVTAEDIKHGTDPDSFAYAHLIEWAVRNKKYEEYYSHMKKFPDDKDRWQEEENLIKNKIVIVTFSFAGVPLFGFLSDYDGEPALMFPGKEELKLVSL
jgi:hypothetical protein